MENTNTPLAGGTGVQIHAPGMWNNDTGPAGWYAISDATRSIFAYAATEADAFTIAERPFPTTPDHQARFLRTLARLINDDVDPFMESLEGYAAAAAAASMLTDWASSDDGTGYLTAVVKRSDVQDVIDILQQWAKKLTDTPAKGSTT